MKACKRLVLLADHVPSFRPCGSLVVGWEIVCVDSAAVFHHNLLAFFHRSCSDRNTKEIVESKQIELERIIALVRIVLGRRVIYRHTQLELVKVLLDELVPI